MAQFKKIAPIVSLLLSLVIGVLFIYAGLIKTLDPARFAVDVSNFRLLPWPAGTLVALYLPWLEILCGAALIFRRLHLGASFILTGFALTFLIALSSAKIRGLDITCGCFGHTNPHSLTASILLDVGILAALIFILTVELKQER